MAASFPFKVAGAGKQQSARANPVGRQRPQTAQSKPVRPSQDKVKPKRNALGDGDQAPDKPAAKRPFPARKDGTVTKKAPAPKFFTDAPEEFKPHFVKVKLVTGKDGLPSRVECVRIDGRWDNVEPRKNNDLSDFDVPTQNALIARLSGKLFATNFAKRLTPNAAFVIWVRVNARGARDNEVKAKLLPRNARVIGARVYAIKRYVKSEKTGKIVGVMLEGDKYKTDLDRRKIRSAGQHLHGAFANALLPPKRVRGKIVGAEED